MTAHPKSTRPPGEMLFFGYSPFPPFLRYHVVDAAGALVRSVDIDLPRSVMMHDFVVTERPRRVLRPPRRVRRRGACCSGGTAIRGSPSTAPASACMPRDGGHRRRRVVRGRSVLRVPLPQRAGTTATRSWSTAAGRPHMPMAFGDEPLTEPRPARHCTGGRSTWPPGRSPTTQLDDRPGDFPRINDASLGHDQPLRLHRPRPAGTTDVVQLRLGGQVRPRGRHLHRSRLRPQRGGRRAGLRPRSRRHGRGRRLAASTSSTTATPRPASCVVVDARDVCRRAGRPRPPAPPCALRLPRQLDARHS